MVIGPLPCEPLTWDSNVRCSVGLLLLEAWRKANFWAVLDNNRSHTPTTVESLSQ